MEIRILLIGIFCSHLFCFVVGNHSFNDTRKRFQDILFIVKYNYKAAPGSVLLHLRMWSRVFVEQVIFVPWTADEITTFTDKNLLGNLNITIVAKKDDSHASPSGYVAYEVVSAAMKSHPNVAGYLFVHDDMAMNVSALMKLDHKYVWQSDYIGEGRCRDLDAEWTNRSNGWWWDSEWGSDAIDKLLSNRTDIAAEMKMSLGSNHIWCGEQSDFFYIPRKYKDVYTRVMSAFYDHGIFLEIAVSTFIRSYIPSDQILRLPLCTFFSEEIRYDFAYMEAECGDAFPLYHPVKLSSKLNVVGMRKKMALIGDNENLTYSSRHR